MKELDTPVEHNSSENESQEENELERSMKSLFCIKETVAWDVLFYFICLMVTNKNLNFFIIILDEDWLNLVYKDSIQTPLPTFPHLSVDFWPSGQAIYSDRMEQIV